MCGVLTKKDKVQTKEECETKRSRFMGALGLNRSRFAFLSCYCDDTDPYVSRKKEQNPMLDIPALEFLKNVRLSECGVAILLC